MGSLIRLVAVGPTSAAASLDMRARAAPSTATVDQMLVSVEQDVYQVPAGLPLPPRLLQPLALRHPRLLQPLALPRPPRHQLRLESRQLELTQARDQLPRDPFRPRSSSGGMWGTRVPTGASPTLMIPVECTRPMTSPRLKCSG